MADQSDVEAALVARVVAALYPAGADAGSVAGTTCRVYRGWPNAAALDADLGARRVNVTVFPDGSEARDTTRWPEQQTALPPVTPQLGVLVSGNTATFFGSAAPGQVAGLLVDTQAVAYRTADGDTPELVAAVLADRIRTPSDGRGRPAQVSGASVTVPGAGAVVARVVADQGVVSELRRQQQGFRITAWCPSAASRDIVAGAIDSALAGTLFIPLADGTAGNLRYISTTVFDQSLNARLYRRDLLYTVEYATTLTQNLPSMLFGTVNIAADGGPVVASRLS
jgi:hypothetical protein